MDVIPAWIQAIASIVGILGLYYVAIQVKLTASQIEDSRLLAKLEHTMNYLNSPLRGDLYKAMDGQLRGKIDYESLARSRTPITKEQLQWLKMTYEQREAGTQCALDAVIARLNYFDTMCLAVKREVLDEEMVRLSLSFVVRSMYFIFRPLIEQRQDMGGFCGHLRDIALKWDPLANPEHRFQQEFAAVAAQQAAADLVARKQTAMLLPVDTAHVSNPKSEPSQSA
jgi:hypothetical protein